ncbi:MAG: hypothetical protein V4579_01905 [Pseudomonadota bacterium]
MNPASAQDPTAAAGEALLRAELAEGAVLRSAIGPVLKQLVACIDLTAFSEEVIARTRGQMRSLADQLLRLAVPGNDIRTVQHGETAALAAALLDQPSIVLHCHAMALEARLTERLAGQAALDPVLSTLLRARLADPDAEIAELASAVLAAQARFMQSQRRMDLAPDDLPADVLHAVLITLGDVCGPPADPIMAAIRARYDEAHIRHGLLARLVLQLGPSWPVALDLAGSGVAIFLTALSFATMRDRAEVLLALGDGQQALLATMLSAAGVERVQIESTMQLIHPDRGPRSHHLQIDQQLAHSLLAGEGAP